MANRFLASAIALSLVVPGASVVALPLQPDHFCWMRDRWGRVVNLNSMCAGVAGPGATESAASVPIPARPEKKASGLTVENVKFVKDEPDDPYVTMLGDISNKGDTETDVDRLNVRVAVMGKPRITGSRKIDRTIAPNSRVSFSIYIPEDEVGNVSMSSLSLADYSFN